MTETAIGESRSAGDGMHELMTRLFPICRSLTGEGVRETFRILSEIAPLDIAEVPSGTNVIDWVVPDEWTIRDAYVMDENDQKVIDFKAHNLHVVGYSEPFEGEMTLEELKPHLHTRPDLPSAIPYVTSYYGKQWGFCLTHGAYERLKPGTYKVKIDSTLSPGVLNYGELLIEGGTREEILLATNVCHPSMANNELSGPVMLAFLARWLMDRPSRRYTYRLLWLPETIGAIAYLARHLEALKERVIAGYQVVCVGGPDDFTYLRSRRRHTLSDRVAERVLGDIGEFRIAEFPERGSDERQWCSPGVDLPIGSIMRSKYHEYREYHTSLDDLEFVQPENLQKSFDAYTSCIDAIERNVTYRLAIPGGEPNLGRRGLHPLKGGSNHQQRELDALFALLAYADGETDLVSIADFHDLPVAELSEAAARLMEHGLIVAA